MSYPARAEGLGKYGNLDGLIGWVWFYGISTIVGYIYQIYRISF